MKRLNEIIQELTIIEENYVLLEGQDYEGMFKPVFSFLDKQFDKLEQQGLVDKDYNNKFIQTLKPNITKYIQEAKSKLKKNDRIIWFLKLYRIYILQKVLFDMKNVLEIEDFRNALTQYITKESKEFNNPQEVLDFTMSRSFESYLGAFAHYFSLPIPEIQSIVFLKQNPRELIEKFRELEDAWEQKQIQITTQ
jgi:hypothetical protein